MSVGTGLLAPARATAAVPAVQAGAVEVAAGPREGGADRRCDPLARTAHPRLGSRPGGPAEVRGSAPRGKAPLAACLARRPEP